MQTIIEDQQRFCLSINVILGQVQWGVSHGVSTGVLDKVFSRVRSFKEDIQSKEQLHLLEQNTAGALGELGC